MAPNRPGRKPGPGRRPKRSSPDGRSDRPRTGDRSGAKGAGRNAEGRSLARRDGGRPNDKRGPGKPARARSTKPTSADDGLVRLNRYLAQSGVASRREADTLIQAGVVTVNGKVVTELGTKVAPGDVVHYGGQRLSMEQKRYVLLNKPKDFITTTADPADRRTVMNLIAHACTERVYPVGRLDRMTTGVLLLTNDGELAKKLTHPSHGAEKIYHATLDQPVSAAHLKQLVDGVELEDGPAQADEASFVPGSDRHEVGIKLHIGRNRIVRRMFEALGYKVVKLDRVLFAGLTKKDLPRGKWRHLREKEVTLLKRIR